MRRNVVVFTELSHDKLRPVSLEVVTAAKQIALDGEVIAVVAGKRVPDLSADLARYGATKVVNVECEALDGYSSDAYLQIWSDIVEKNNPDVILAPHTALGKDISPRLAVKFDLGLISDCTAVELLNERIVFTRPIYAGKAFMKRTFKDGHTVFATIRPNNVTALEVTNVATATIENLSIDLKTDSLRTVVEETVQKSSDGVDLSEARIVVAGGRGVKSAAGFQPLQQLADVLGAAVGASRGACDAEYCDYALQIGQTGKVVTPDLYIACGISGAIQHLAGMSNSKVIVAINKDPEAAIYQVADYGIVGDLFEVVPKLTAAFKEALTKA